MCLGGGHCRTGVWSCAGAAMLPCVRISRLQQHSSPVHTSPVTTGQPVRRCLRAQAVARSQIVHSCVQAGLGPISLNSMGDAIGWPSHACVWSVGYLFSKIHLCAIVCSSCNNTPADSCSNGVRFHTSMSKWKNKSFFLLELKNDTV
jgi:hypothetical protein